MAKAKFLTYVEGTKASDYGYPDDVHVVIFQNDTIQIHHIYGAVTPSSTVCANAPNGSLLFDATLNTGKVWIKTGTLGKADGTWKYVAVTT